MKSTQTALFTESSVNLKALKVLILSTSLLTNRLLSKSFFNEIGEQATTTVWAAKKPLFMPDNCTFKPFPAVKNNRERVNLVRRINDKAWAVKLGLVSILSMERFNNSRQKPSTSQKVLDLLGRLVALLNLHHFTDRLVKRLVQSQDRSKEGLEELKKLAPDVVVVTNPFWYHETSIAIEAQKLGIKVYSVIPSWDNITTKSRLTFDADKYFVWSALRSKELHRVYPLSNKVPTFEYGTPQYECFFDEELMWTKEEFCSLYNLDPNKKIIVYATGSPNFLKTEYDGAEKFAQLFAEDSSFENVQLLIRPHPNKDNNELQSLNRPDKDIFIQFTDSGGLPTIERNVNIESAKIWINTFRHCDLVINLSSTVLLDTIALSKPVININFDPNDKKEYEDFIKEINHEWSHLITIRDCAAIPQANTMEDLKNLSLHYLSNPEDGMEERRAVFNQICLNPQHELGKKLAQEILTL